MKKKYFWLLAYTVAIIAISAVCTTKWIEYFVLNGNDQEMLIDYGANAPQSSPLKESAPIVEVFSYGCHFCEKNEANVDALEKTLPAKQKITRLHINDGNNGWLSATAKIYATLRVMGIEDNYRSKLYDLVINKKADITNAEQFDQWLRENNIDVTTFRNTEKSEQVKQLMDYLQSVTRYYKVSGTPAFIVNKRWVAFQDDEFPTFGKKLVTLSESNAGKSN